MVLIICIFTVLSSKIVEKGGIFSRINKSWFDGYKIMVKISLTPIIDVVFILLIFFMLATNFQKFNQMNLNIATESAAPSVLDKELFIIEFNNAGNYKMNGAPYKLDELKKIITSKIVDSPEYIVVLESSESSQLQSIFSLLETLHKDEIKNISIGVKKNETQE